MIAKEVDESIANRDKVQESTKEADAKSNITSGNSHPKKEIDDVNATKTEGSESNKTSGNSHSKRDIDDLNATKTEGSESNKTSGNSHSKRDIDDLNATKTKGSESNKTSGKSHSKKAQQPEEVVMEKAAPLSLPEGESLALSPLFASHMVVPAGLNFTMSGVAEEGSGPVEVSMGGETASAELKEGGEWSVTMQAMDASKDPILIQIKSTKASIELTDILIGDVYICTGAGNVDYQLQLSTDGESALKAAETESLGDRLRIMSVAEKPCCAVPQTNFTTKAEWQRVWSEGPTAEFSALCYYFGVEQLNRRPDMPVGLIQASAVDSGSWQWAAPEIVKDCEKPEDMSDDVISIYWNSMLRPLTALKGVRAFIVEVDGDGCGLLGTFKMMQSIWSTMKQDGSGIEVPALLSSQFSCTSPKELMGENYEFQQAFLKIPRASLAVTADLCRPDTPGCGHHSPNKLEEARRLAIRAESVVHQDISVPKSFPRPVDVYVDPYNESWGAYHFGAIGDPICTPCIWGMRIVFDQDLDYRDEFKDFKGYMGHINGFLIHPNTKPGVDYFPITPQFNGIEGNTLQLNMSIKVGELGGVTHPFPAMLLYGEGPFPVMPILGAATGEPASQFSIQVPMGKGEKVFKDWSNWELVKVKMAEQAKQAEEQAKQAEKETE